MNVQDRSDATVSGTLMVGLRSATILKYLVFVGEIATYELITKIPHHIEAKKTSNLEARKLSQDILLRGKHKEFSIFH